jgi:uncharacterized membrane protein
MIPQDAVFLSLVVGLPIVVSVLMFRNEPLDRPFLATFALTVIGSLIGFVVASLALHVLGVSGLEMFDGAIQFVLSLPIALVAGFIVRANRARRTSFFSRVQ